MFYSDNPIADFERHDAQQEEELQKLPICCECGEPIQSDYLYEIDGELYCEDCMNEMFRKDVEEYCE
jgi:formylmethanofuran dehydrogenase subunit E